MAAAALAASRRDLEGLGLAKAVVDALQQPDAGRVETALAFAQAPHQAVVCLGDEDYPSLLLETPQPPVVLFLRGHLELLNTPQLAVVGTRHPTPQGEQTAYDFARHLAEGGLVITSGLALGIDAAAHRGALEASGGATVAVLGTGIDRVYPARHRALAHTIAERGLLVSEFPLGTPPLPEHFPRRNRLISGLSLGTLVVEAALNSGSLVTARHALEQGREVLAIPGSIHNPQARGCHALLRQGAKLVETALDVIEELAPWLHAIHQPQALDEGPTTTRRATALPGEAAASSSAALVADAPAEAAPGDFDEDYRTLLNQLADGPISVDELVERCGLTAEVVSSMLLILELQGYVVAMPGGRYRRIAARNES